MSLLEQLVQKCAEADLELIFTKVGIKAENIHADNHQHLKEVNFSKGSRFANAENCNTRKQSLLTSKKGVKVEQIGDELSNLNTLLWCKVSDRFYMRLNTEGVKFPNIARIEVSETPYNNYSWTEIGSLRSGKAKQLYCCIHKSILISKQYNIDLITIGLSKLGLIANSVVKPSNVRKDNVYGQTEYWQAVVQRELGIKLTFDPKNPTIAYTVEHCYNW